MIPRTNLHNFRVVEQIKQNLIQLQRDLVNNAKTHKAMSVAQSPDVSSLALFISDCTVQYLRRIKWITDLRNDPIKKQRMLDILWKMGWTEEDITDVVTPLRQVIISLRDAPKTTYQEIITACDIILATVNPPDSLWEE